MGEKDSISRRKLDRLKLHVFKEMFDVMEDGIENSTHRLFLEHTRGKANWVKAKVKSRKF